MSNRWIHVSIALWATAVSAGAVELWRYQLTPGRAPASAPQVWPDDAGIPAHAGQPLLLMVAHPYCACTRASLNELRRLVTRFNALENPPLLYLSVTTPKGQDAAVREGPVLRNAATIEGLNVVMDPEGRFAARLGATTSGHTLLYGADGALLYSGGITAARAHEGDAVGQDAIVAALYGRTPASREAPVFGCGVHTPETPSASPV
jgi:hypothetical protein